MTSSRTSPNGAFYETDTDEKAQQPGAPSAGQVEGKLEHGSDSASSQGTKPASTDAVVSKGEEAPKPAGFFEMFKYATWFEVSINAVGLLCAAAGGAAQVSLLSTAVYTALGYCCNLD